MGRAAGSESLALPLCVHTILHARFCSREGQAHTCRRPLALASPCHCFQVELVSEGDSVNELFIVVSGQLSSYRVSSLFNSEVRCGAGWATCLHSVRLCCGWCVCATRTPAVAVVARANGQGNTGRQGQYRGKQWAVKQCRGDNSSGKEGEYNARGQI